MSSTPLAQAVQATFAPGGPLAQAAEGFVARDGQTQLAQAVAARDIVVLALHPGWVQTEMGGEHATVPTADAVAGLLRVIDGATLPQSGSFLDWRGEPLPW